MLGRRQGGALLGLKAPLRSSHAAASTEGSCRVEEVAVRVALDVGLHALVRSVPAHAHQVGSAALACVAVGQASPPKRVRHELPEPPSWSTVAVVATLAAHDLTEQVVANDLVGVVPRRGHTVVRHEWVFRPRVGLVVHAPAEALRVHVAELGQDVVGVTFIIWNLKASELRRDRQA